MEIVTDRNTCRGKLIFFLFALVVLAGFRPGFAEGQDIDALREGLASFRMAAEQGQPYCPTKPWPFLRQGRAPQIPDSRSPLTKLGRRPCGTPRNQRQVPEFSAANITPDQITQTQKLAALLEYTQDTRIEK